MVNEKDDRGQGGFLSDRLGSPRPSRITETIALNNRSELTDRTETLGQSKPIEKSKSLNKSNIKPEALKGTAELSSMPRSARFKVLVPIFVVSMGVLVFGVTFFLINVFSRLKVRDADFLVSASDWVREDTEGVVWRFTEIGKGELTTNNGLNTYDFIWAIQGNELKIETDWLYKLNNNYEYKLNQDTRTLVLSSGEGEVVFISEADE